jgi:uncharacterized protein (TIGR00297 family)
MAGWRRQTVLGLIGAAVIALAARRVRALSPGGAVAATVVGGAVFGGTGLRGSAAVLGFFVSSTLLGRLPGGVARQQQRGNERDAVQVLANGGTAALLALASGAAPEKLRPVLQAGFGGAIAAAAADTWATEIGSRSWSTPRSIVTLRAVPPGASGAVTVAGLVASAVGATVIAVVFGGSTRFTDQVPRLRLAAVALGGFVGSLIDSLLGATVQEVRFCDACGRETELLIHDCGRTTRRVRGASWCDNDVVNGVATASGALVAMGVVMVINRWTD